MVPALNLDLGTDPFDEGVGDEGRFPFTEPFTVLILLYNKRHRGLGRMEEVDKITAGGLDSGL